MTMPEVLFAWTAPGSNYPEYVNIQSDGTTVFVNVRGAPDIANQRSGYTVQVKVPFEARQPTAFPALMGKATAATGGMTENLKERIRRALLQGAYQQSTDSDGWYRECKFCGEMSRIGTHYDDFPHSVACVLSDLDRLQATEARQDSAVGGETEGVRE